MTKVTPILLATLLALGALSALPTVQAATGQVSFVDLGHDLVGGASLVKDGPDGGSIPELVGSGAIGVVRLIDSDIKGLNTATVTVKSGTDSAGETITLYNEDSSTGTFFGTFGVESTAVSGNGLVQVGNGGQFFVQYTDANSDSGPNFPVSNSNALEWRSAADGTISLPDDLLGSSSVTVTITDPDSNVNSGAADPLPASANAHAFSTTSPTGVDLSFIDSASDPGDFTADLPFSTAASPPVGTLKVADGDTVTVVFTDVDARGRSVDRQATAVWHRTSDGTIAFTDSTFSKALPADLTLNSLTLGHVGGLGDKMANLRVEDPDLIGVSSINAIVSSSQDSIGIEVPLASTGTNTGEFTGQVGFTTGDSGSNKIRVSTSGSVITAKYIDAKAANGAQVTRSVQVHWIGVAPTIRFTDETYNNDVASSGKDVPPHLQVSAPSYDISPTAKDTLQVFVTSDRDPLGIVVTLTESDVHSGLFRDSGTGTWNSVPNTKQAFGYANTQGGTGSERESTAAGGDGVMLVRGDADSLKAEFTDARGSGAKVSDLLKVTGASTPPEAKGTILLKSCTANCDSDNPTLTAAQATFYGNRAESIFVEMTDTNRDGLNASKKDEINVTVGSFNAGRVNDSPLQWKADGKGLEGGIIVKLTETGVDTKKFVGKFGTTTSTTPGPGLLKVGGNGVVNTIGAAYAYYEHKFNTVPYNPDPVTAPCKNGSAKAPVPPLCGADDQVGRGVAYTTAFQVVTQESSLSFRSKLREGTSLGPSDSFIGLGNGFIALTGIDPGEDVGNTANTVKVKVRSTSDRNAGGNGIDVILTERYAHAAVDDLHLGPDADNAFLGQFTFTTDASSQTAGKLKVANGDTIEVSYTDPHGDDGNTASVSKTTTWKAGATGKLEVPAFIRAGSSNDIVRVTDSDQNTDGGEQTVDVLVIPQRTSEDAFTLTLRETDNDNTGIFEAHLPVQASCAADQVACVTSGDRVTVRYVDPKALTGGSATVESSFIGLDSTGGLLVLDHTAYSTAGATAIVALEDPDLGTSPSVQEEVIVRVLSDTDGEGERLTLLEDGKDAHRFLGSFGFETGRAEGNGKIHVAEGDRVTVYYLDADTGAASDVAVLTSALWSSTASSAPKAELKVTPASGPAPLDVTFAITASDADGAIASYTLNFGDGASSPGTGTPPTSATHTYAADGSYTARLTVTDNGGLIGYSNVTVTVGAVSPPTLTGVSPNQGLPAGGTLVTLTGTNFASGATVTFGGVAATNVTFVSATQLTAKTPAHDAGTVDVVVTVGALTAPKTGGFTYTSNPTTTSSSSSTSGGTNPNTSTTGTSTGPGGAPTAAQILSANQKVKVTVTHEDGKNTVKFELPKTGLPATVLGVQVWRSNSPYTLVATLPSSDPDFKDGSYVDDDAAQAKDTTKYLVTMYYGATSAFGLFTQATAPDTAQYKGTSSADSSGSGGDGGALPSWAIVLIIVGILFLVVLVAVLIARGRNREAQGAAAQGYAWQESTETEAKAAEGEWQPPAEVHQARCPSCGTSFTAAGTKPIVTVCPGCGKKGILR